MRLIVALLAAAGLVVYLAFRHMAPAVPAAGDVPPIPEVDSAGGVSASVTVTLGARPAIPPARP